MSERVRMLKNDIAFQMRESRIFSLAGSKTRFYGLLGHPVGHSYSPMIHQMIACELGTDQVYDVFDIDAPDLAANLPLLRERFSGFNCTIPLKQAILPYLDELEEKAARFGAVNTVKNEDGRLIGYNTDAYGFRRALTRAGIPLAGRALLLGAGGVARVMAFEAASAGCDLTIAARNCCKASALAADVYSACPQASVHSLNLAKVRGSFDLIINATPVGMFPHTDACPVDERLIAAARYVYDAIYNPLATKLVRCARAAGLVAENGASMLVYQAIEAARIWHGKEVSAACTEQILARLNHNLEEGARR